MSDCDEAEWFTLGIEEEYLLVDRILKFIVPDPSPALFEACKQALGPQVSHELMRSQIEVATTRHRTIGSARNDLANLRRTVAGIANSNGLAPIAAGTHPFAEWSDAIHTPRERYDRVVTDLQAVGRRAVTCGLQVHVGIPDDEIRIDIMNRITPFLPVLLALSTSSPFWRGESTGLKCYRLAVYDEWPRTGLPETFAAWSEYQDFLEKLVAADLIPNAGMIWWAIRPSQRFSTLELRIADSCTIISHAVTIAALFQCLVRCVHRRQELNRDYAGYRRLFVDENRWRAQRFGIDAELLDWRRGRLIAMQTLVSEMIDLVADDAKALDCVAEVRAAAEILARGTSADYQLRCYRSSISDGREHKQALQDVVKWLESETISEL